MRPKNGVAAEVAVLGLAIFEITHDTPPVSVWNDAPDRTFDDVIDVLDRAEKIAEQREALDA